MDRFKQILDSLSALSIIDLRSKCKAHNMRYDPLLKRPLLEKKLAEVLLAEENREPDGEANKQDKATESQVEVIFTSEENAEPSVKELGEEKPSKETFEERPKVNDTLQEVNVKSCEPDTSNISDGDNEEVQAETKEYIPSSQNQQNHYEEKKHGDKDYRRQPERGGDKRNNLNRGPINTRGTNGRNYSNRNNPNNVSDTQARGNNNGPANNKLQGKTYKKQEQDRKPQEPEYDENGIEKEVDVTGCEIRSGVLELCQEGYGFLRGENYQISNKDSFVGSQFTRRFGLRVGDFVVGYVKQGENPNKPPAIVKIIEINGRAPVENLKRPYFEDFVPIYPDELIRLEIKGKRNDLAVRAIDLVAPIGKGQRAMVVSPPKAGKTTLLKMIANSISINHPECKLLVLLIDERPEEVTDMQRSINGEVVYSTFDEESGNHIKIAELVLTRAKRLVEEGHDVVILLDSLTRMARANNVIVPSSGKTLSGGVDPVALYFPKRFFGAARNIENGGSLTIIATALVDTGSRMDDIVYEEFKGTGNMEIHLDRRLSEKRIFPAIDLYKSGTRREELLLSQQELEAAYLMRKLLSAGDPQEAAESIITMMMRTSSNAELTTCLKDQIAKLKKDGYRF